MSTKGTLYVVNTSGMDLKIHIKNKKRWVHFNVGAGKQKSSKIGRVSGNDWYYGKKSKRNGRITDKNGAELWKGKFKFYNLQAMADGFAIVYDELAADAPANIKVEIADYEDIIKLIIKYFLGSAVSTSEEDDNDANDFDFSKSVDITDGMDVDDED